MISNGIHLSVLNKATLNFSNSRLPLFQYQHFPLTGCSFLNRCQPKPWSLPFFFSSLPRPSFGLAALDWFYHWWFQNCRNSREKSLNISNFLLRASIIQTISLLPSCNAACNRLEPVGGMSSKNRSRHWRQPATASLVVFVYFSLCVCIFVFVYFEGKCSENQSQSSLTSPATSSHNFLFNFNVKFFSPA